MSLPKANVGGEVGFGRFLRNPSITVTVTALNEAAGNRTADRVTGRDDLAIQDTSEIVLSGPKMRKAGFGPVSIKRPERGMPSLDLKRLPEMAKLHLVDIFEVDVPKGAGAIHWRLLTSHEVEDFGMAPLMLDFYRKRWIIKECFPPSARTMKAKRQQSARKILIRRIHWLLPLGSSLEHVAENWAPVFRLQHAHKQRE